MSRLARYRYLLAPVAFLALGGMLFSVTGRDDLFKTLFAAEALAEQGRILNYNGAAVEQSSSLLMVLLLGGLKGLFGGATTTWTLVLSLGAFALSIPLTVKIALQIKVEGQGSRWLPWLLASAAFGLYWAWSGMETTLAAACLLWVLSGCLDWMEEGKWGRFILALPFFLLVRPENGMLLSLALLLAVVWVGEWRKKLLVALGAVVLGSCLLAGLRFGLFGSIFPLPVEAKAEGLSFFRAYKGLGYLYRSSIRHPDFLIMGLVALIGWVKWMGKGRETAAGRRLIALAALAGCLFVIASGGDWMENGRFWVPISPLLLLLAADLAAAVKWLLPALITLQIFGIAWTAFQHSSGRPVWEVPSEPRSFSFLERANRFHYRDIATVQALSPIVDSLHQELHRPVRILSQQAGMVIYHIAASHSQKIHFTDLVGLSTLDFHHCPPIQARGKGFGGLNMDLIFLFEHLDTISSHCHFQAPDLIFDLDNDRRLKRDFLSQRGYKIVYEQEGRIENGALFPGIEVSAVQFIARKENSSSP